MMLFGNINRGLEECRATSGAILVDVREADEFASGHIPGAVNEPLSTVNKTALPKGRPAVPLLSAWNPEQAGGGNTEEDGIHCEEHRRDQRI